MGHFARVDKNNIVQEVIRADWDFLDANPQLLQEGDKWLRTSYNTFAGEHNTGEWPPLRKNFAGIGYTYDENRNAFIPPKLYSSWTLDEDTCLWVPPHEPPNGDYYSYLWNEEQQEWVAVND